MPYLGRSPGSGVRSRFIYAATSGQTSFSGNDSNSVSLAYEDTLYMDVYQNGVLLKPVTDYAATTGTSVVLTTGATTDDVVEMIVYDTFAVADTVSASNGGTFSGNVAVTGNITTTGTVEPAGDTSAGDNAAIGFTSAEGLILTGQGSTSDITLKNDADGTVFTVPTGTDDILFPDNAKILMGAGSDLELYHDGSHSFIQENNSGGNLYIQASNLRLGNTAGSELYMQANENAEVKLYYDASEKLATTSTGVDITGAFTATDGCTITTADNSAQLTLVSTDADSGAGPILVMNRDSGSPADGDSLGQISYKFDNDAAESTEGVRLDGIILDASDGTEDVQFELSTLMAGTFRSRMKLGTETVFNEASQDIDFRVESDGNANALLVDAGTNNVLIGSTEVAPRNLSSGTGIRLGTDGSIEAAKATDPPGRFNRTGDDGEVIQIRRDGTSRGRFGIKSTYPYIGEGGTGLLFEHDSSVIEPFNVGTASARDDAIDLGGASVRFDDIRATNGTIQTSDQNDKQQIASLTSTEIAAAKAISALFKTYKWNKSVTANGDAARTHTGVVAQEVQAAMSAVGLDATKYAFWCSDTWWEHSVDVAAVEADDEAGIEAKDAYSRIDIYKTSEEAPTGATERTRLGIRYPELMSFVLASIEDRLTALENA